MWYKKYITDKESSLKPEKRDDMLHWKNYEQLSVDRMREAWVMGEQELQEHDTQEVAGDWFQRTPCAKPKSSNILLKFQATTERLQALGDGITFVLLQ